MATVLERAKLARLAARLNASAWPHLLLVTDDLRLPDPLAAAKALPPGSGVIVRAKDVKRREELARALVGIARAKDLLIFVSQDPALALAVGAPGVHLPEANIADAARIRATSDLLITAAAHAPQALMRAKLSGADAALLSPVFPTESHKQAGSLSPSRASLMARQANIPVYALGGVSAANAARITGFTGIAAIGALTA